jgi:hypothetical protein
MSAMKSNNRRSFLRGLAGLAGLVTPARSQSRPIRPPEIPPGLSQRSQTALRIREEAALFQCTQPPANPVSNGDETSLPNYIASFTKGLPHTQLGEVEPGTYQTLLYALSTGQQSDFENIDRGSGMKFQDPLAAFAYQMEGADSHILGTPQRPHSAAPMAPGRWWNSTGRRSRAMCHLPITVRPPSHKRRFRISTVSPRSVARLSTEKSLPEPSSAEMFSAPSPDLTFPSSYGSPFPSIPLLLTNCTRQGHRASTTCRPFDEWLVLQAGVPPFRAWTSDPTPKYIYNGRALAEWVHYDFLYQAFHNAALILLN